MQPAEDISEFPKKRRASAKGRKDSAKQRPRASAPEDDQRLLFNNSKHQKLLDFLPVLLNHAEVKKKLELEGSLQDAEQDPQISSKIQKINKQSELEIVREEEHEDTMISGTASQSASEVKCDVKAKRHNFQFNNTYHVQNIKIDSVCYRLEHSGELQARVVADTAIEPEAEELYHADYMNSRVEAAKNKSKAFLYSMQLQKHWYYFQFRIDELEGDVVNPKICVGICREDFKVNQDVNTQKHVWCLNLNTGDKYSGGKWKEYCSVLEAQPGASKRSQAAASRSLTFKPGSVVGVLVNTKRGKVHFFKDGKDLGEAFSQEELTKGQLYPFIQLIDKCKMSIFHPDSYDLEHLKRLRHQARVDPARLQSPDQDQVPDELHLSVADL